MLSIAHYSNPFILEMPPQTHTHTHTREHTTEDRIAGYTDERKLQRELGPIIVTMTTGDGEEGSHTAL